MKDILHAACAICGIERLAWCGSLKGEAKGASI